MSAEQDGRMSESPDRTSAVLARAEADWRATPPDLGGWVALSRDTSKVLRAEYDRLKAIEAALGPVVEHLAEMDDEDLAALHDVAPDGFVKALVDVLKASAVVVRAEPS